MQETATSKLTVYYWSRFLPQSKKKDCGEKKLKVTIESHTLKLWDTQLWATRKSHKWDKLRLNICGEYD